MIKYICENEEAKSILMTIGFVRNVPAANGVDMKLWRELSCAVRLTCACLCIFTPLFLFCSHKIGFNISGGEIHCV